MMVTLNVTGKYLEDEDKFPVVWTAKTNPELALIAPGAGGMLTAKIKLSAIKTSNQLDGLTNQTINFSSTAEYSVDGMPTRTFHTDSGITEIPISTFLNVDAVALYYSADGDQLGIGPIPPQVNENTHLWIAVTVKNGANAIHDAQLRATLMPAATWSGKTSVTTGRPLVFIASKRQVIWEIGDLSAFTGDLLPHATANFEIEIQPNESMIGLVPLILDSLIIEGVDDFTGERVSAKGDGVTTAVRFGSPKAQQGLIEAQ
jgi:hypothetical protein